MKVPYGGRTVLQIQGDYVGSGTTVQTYGAYAAFTYTVPSGWELWVKGLAILPNSTATSKGLFAILLGNSDSQQNGVPIPTSSNFDFNWEEVIPQTKSVTVYLWSTDGTAVGAQISLYGKLFPEGEYQRRFP